MPPVLWAFFILIGLSLGSIGNEKPKPWAGVDPTNRTKLEKPERGFYTWSSATPFMVATRDFRGVESCLAVVFGVSLGQRRVRAQFDGFEQELSWSWRQDVSAKPGERRVTTVRYLSPVGGEELACHETAFTCVPDVGWDGRVRVTLTYGEPCRPDGRAIEVVKVGNTEER